MDAIAHDEEAGLFARHEFLDHHFGPGGPEFSTEHVVDGRQGLGLGHCADDALSCRQSIGLDDDGGA